MRSYLKNIHHKKGLLEWLKVVHETLSQKTLQKIGLVE
jgi:hypothetical protein